MGNNRKKAAPEPVDQDRPVMDGSDAAAGFAAPASEGVYEPEEPQAGSPEGGQAEDVIDPPPAEIEFLDLSKMYGTVRDAIPHRVKASPRPWHQLAAREQRELSEGIGLVASRVIRGVVEKLQDYRFPRVVVQIGDVKITAKGVVEAKITCNAIPENLSVMADAVGEWATLLMVDSDAFMGEAREVRIDEDQHSLPLDADAAPVPEVPPAEGAAEEPVEETAELPLEAGGEAGPVGFPAEDPAPEPVEA